MRYFALGNKANIKITDDRLTLEDVKNDAIRMKIITPEEADQIREIKRDEFIKPIDTFKEEALTSRPIRRGGRVVQQVQEEEEKESEWGVIPSWQSIVDELRINSTKEELSPFEKERAKKKKYYGK